MAAGCETDNFTNFWLNEDPSSRWITLQTSTTRDQIQLVSYPKWSKSSPMCIRLYVFTSFQPSSRPSTTLLTGTNTLLVLRLQNLVKDPSSLDPYICIKIINELNTGITKRQHDWPHMESIIFIFEWNTHALQKYVDTYVAKTLCFLVSYVGEESWWPIKSSDNSRKKKVNG